MILYNFQASVNGGDPKSDPSKTGNIKNGHCEGQKSGPFETEQLPA